MQFFSKNYKGKTVLGKPAAVCTTNEDKGIKIYGYCTVNGHFMITKDDFYSMYLPEQYD